MTIKEEVEQPEPCG